ncbi:MAG: B12-binding domain-containing radical SAM protein [Chloroflexi bacterium]|nr:B12-binding domain-containing radical SAM protein [Chloroflexota bacterium]
MNILLVYPEFPDTFWSFKHALGFIHKKASSPPLGLATVAAMLPAEWNKRLVDLNVRALAGPDLEWADYVFLSAMVVQRKSAIEVIARCKEAGVRVVAGGPLFTCESTQFDDVDTLVLNEAELTLKPFLEDLEQGRPQHLYTTSEYPDLHQTPVPMWELVERDRYDSMTIQYSRGCPFNCDFCNVTALLGHRPRTKTAVQILAELDKIYSLGWRRNVFFVDDNFIGNKKELKNEILPALIEWRKGKKAGAFITEVSINLADDPELMDLMVKAGFNSVFVGIETPDEGSLTECHKTQNKGRNLVESVKRLQRNGLQVMGGFIVGFDSDTASIFQRQIDFIQQSGIVTAMVGLLQAPYGTKLYQRMEEEGRLIKEMSGDNADGTTNIVPKMDIEILRTGYKNIMNQIYSADLFYERVRNFLREYNPPKVNVRIEFQEVLAFFRSVYQIGIKGKERLHYWRLFLWTLFRCPSKFPLAITFAIYGFHFRKVSELHIS